MPSGLLLIAGGASFRDSNEPEGCTEVYNPGTGGSLLVGAMKIPREGHQATLLASGEVLVSGGSGVNGQLVGPAEIYDPNTGTWSLTGALNQFRAGHAAVRLLSGEVLVVGGSGASGALASAEIYDRAKGGWIPVSAMDRPVSSPRALILTDGRILVAQGAFSQLYNRATNTWAPSVPIADTSQFPLELIVLRDGPRS